MVYGNCEVPYGICFFDISGSRARACMKKYSYSFNAYFDILPGRMPGRQKKD